MIFENSELFTISVLGEFSSGKTTLVNALFLGKNLLPISQGVCTPVPTEIIYSETMTLEVVFKNKIKKIFSGYDKVVSALKENSEVCHPELEQFILKLPIEKLKGMRIIDTPGLNSPHERHSELTKKMIGHQTSDLVLWVIDLTYGATETGLTILENLKDANYHCVLVANQIDLVARNGGGKQAIESAVEKLKENAYMFPVVFPTCALDGLRGIGQKKNLYKKSRISDLSGFISEEKLKWQTSVNHEREYGKKLEEHRRLISCNDRTVNAIEKTKIRLERYLYKEAIPKLEKRFTDKKYKDKLAAEIDKLIDEADQTHSTATSPYRFVLLLKNDTLMYINALLMVHMSSCLYDYSEEIKAFCKKEIQKILPVSSNGKIDDFLRVSSFTGSPEDTVEEVLGNILKTLTSLIAAIGTGISTMFIQTTSTYLIFFTSTVWNPWGIAVLVFCALLSLGGVLNITSVKKKVKNELLDQFGVSKEGKHSDYKGVINQIWNGGSLDIPNKKMGFFSGPCLHATEAGKKLLEEIENPPAIASVMKEGHIRWALAQLSISGTSDKGEKICKEIMDSLKKVTTQNNQSHIPSMRNERKCDFRRIWEGLEPDGSPVVLDNGETMQGLKLEFDKILSDLEERISKLDEELKTQADKLSN